MASKPSLDSNLFNANSALENTHFANRFKSFQKVPSYSSDCCCCSDKVARRAVRHSHFVANSLDSEFNNFVNGEEKVFQLRGARRELLAQIRSGLLEREQALLFHLRRFTLSSQNKFQIY